jgi:hypothetical protein
MVRARVRVINQSKLNPGNRVRHLLFFGFYAQCEIALLSELSNLVADW